MFSNLKGDRLDDLRSVSGDVLDAVYVEESSDIDESLAEMQLASLSKEDW